MDVGVSATDNTVNQTVEAYLGQGALVTATGNGSGVFDPAGSGFGGQGISLSAVTNNVILVIAAGVAVSSNSTAVAGSVAINNVNGNTAAFTEGATVNLPIAQINGSSLRLQGTYATDITTIGGGFGGGSDFGVGAAVATNTISDTAAAFIDKSVVQSPAGSGVNLAAANNPASILCITVGAGVGSTGGLAGSVSLNSTVNNTTDAHISGGSQVTGFNGISLTATDDPTIEAFAGAVAGASTAAIGAAFSTNTISDTTKAYIDGSTVEGGGIAMTSTSDPTIESLTAAGAGAGTFAGGGAVGINNITNTTEVFITDGATVDAGVTMTALDSPTIEAGAGALDAAGSVAISAGIATNNIGDTVTAYVDGASTISAGAVSASATEDASIEAASLGVSASADVAVSGGIGVNQIDNTTDAHVPGGASITASGNISFIAQDTSSNTSFTGQAAGSLVGIGGAVSYNVIGNHVRAYVNGAKLTTTSAGDIIINAISTATINTITAGLSGGFVGIAGTVAVTLMNTNVMAYLVAAVVNCSGDMVVFANSTNQLQVIALPWRAEQSALAERLWSTP